MNILNPKPRFGLTAETGMIYDYVLQRDVKPVANYAAVDGTWDLTKVAAAILAGTNIEMAHLTVKAPAPKVTPPVAAKPTAPINAKPVAAATETMQAAVPGLSAEQLTGLKLSALQAAALGISPTQLNVTGVTGQQVGNWGMNATRAEALKLTAEQRKVLLPST
jgi:hypothetical protein